MIEKLPIRRAKFCILTVILLNLYLISSACAKNAASEVLRQEHKTSIRVIDGDTLQLGVERIRLWGIDAPELHQKCYLQEKEIHCGQASKVALMSIIQSGSLICSIKDIDRYKRMVSQCFVDGKDVAGLLVLSGWALDYPQYSKGFYNDYQAEAKHENRGIWKLKYVTPSLWRKGVRQYK